MTVSPTKIVEARVRLTVLAEALTEETVIVSEPNPVKARETVKRAAAAVVEERVSL